MGHTQSPSYEVERASLFFSDRKSSGKGIVIEVALSLFETFSKLLVKMSLFGGKLHEIY